MLLYQFLDYFFIIFHTAFILFNITGWIFKITRKFNLITLSLTSFSWYILGLFYGFGYCICTDWHFLVREKLGYEDISMSYIHFLILRITGINFNERLVIVCTVIVFFISFVASIAFNTADLIGFIRKKKQR
jgi:hypothetical protein